MTTRPTSTSCWRSSTTFRRASGAAFVCAAAFVAPAGRGAVVDGRLDGALHRAPGGPTSGYDPIFVPAGDSRTTAEITPAEKDAISHRGGAFRALAPLIAAALTG